ncbi:alpha/beta fold hydrolase [Nocardia sp. NPDC051321]|uniref:alpha/beta fold hydrolase n=1 Tax=Nocardia sp. NPDC051321 TaxID=3364323 RepID=UPI0037AE9816
MTIEMARHGDIELAYETIGPPTGEPLLLISGISQMLIWHDDAIAGLVERGFQVVRFDNRDTGLSTHLHRAGRPSKLDLLLRPTQAVRYHLTDLADDAVAVLDALNWDSAHVVGESLGGTIAQSMAVRHPDRVRSLTSIGAGPSPRIGGPRVRTLLRFLVLARKPINSAEDYAEHMEALELIAGSPDYPQDETWLRELGKRSYERGHDQAGVERLSVALRASGDRRGELAAVRVPTLVVHGLADKTARPVAGSATAAAIPGARLVTYPGMPSHVPPQLWPDVINEIAAIAGLDGDRNERKPG